MFRGEQHARNDAADQHLMAQTINIQQCSIIFEYVRMILMVELRSPGLSHPKSSVMFDDFQFFPNSADYVWLCRHFLVWALSVGHDDLSGMQRPSPKAKAGSTI